MPRLRPAWSSVAALRAFATPVRADHPSAGFSHGIAGPIVTIPAEIMPNGTWAVTARSEFISFDPFSDQALEAGALAGMEARWSVSASVGIPVLQDWHGEQHDTSVRVRLGPGIAF